MRARLVRLKFVCWIVILAVLCVIQGTAQDVASQSLSENVCSDEVQQVACFYDRSRSAIIGVEYTLRNSRAKRRLCHTLGQPGNTIRLRRGVGVTKLTVISAASRVLSLEFKLSNGRTAFCKVASHDGARVGSAEEVAAAASALDSTDVASTADARAVSGVSTSSVVEDYLNRYLDKINQSPSICTGSNCVGVSPSPSPPPSPPQRSRVYVGPNQAYVLAGLSGTCASSGQSSDSLQRITRPCWVKAASPPVPSPVVSPSPSPRPSPRPSPTPRPTRSPSPRPSPGTSPKPQTSPSPSPVPSGLDGSLNVTLYARSQTACSSFGLDAIGNLRAHINQQLVLLGLGTYSSINQGMTICSCNSQQGMPMYSCNFSVQGPSSSLWEGRTVARYLAASLTAAGHHFCTSQFSAQNLGSICGGSLQITGLCAASLQSNSAPLACTVPTPPSAWQMAVSLGIPGAACSSSINMTAGGADSLVQYLSGFLPGYNVTLPAWATKPLTCSRVQGNAYYQVPAVTIAALRNTDTRGAAEYLAATLNMQQPGPCSSDRSGGSTSASGIKPAFCSELPQMPVMCGTATYTFKDAPVGCSSAGASFNILFQNPNDSCERGNPPPDAIGQSLDSWWRQQLDWLSNGKLYNATTILPGNATIVNGVCNYRYTVRVLGPVSFTPQQIDDKALELMSSALMHAPVPCASWRSMQFCTYFEAAKFCAAMAPSAAEC